MTLATKLAGRLARLGPATHEVSSELGLEVKMRDGVVLLADRHYPSDLPHAPVILVRTPYGRSTLMDPLQGRLFAERGFQYVVQSCRGTFGSGGEFVPFVEEAEDGAETMRWLREQPWCEGPVGTLGASYLGYTQWALATGDEPVEAVALSVTASSLREVMWPGGVFGLDVALSWSHTVHHQERGLGTVLRTTLSQRRALRPAFAHLPMQDDDRLALGASSDVFQLFVGAGARDADLWRRSDRPAAALTAPASFTAGWYDLFLRSQLADVEALLAAGRTPRLVIGPWAHTSPGLFGASLREALAWHDQHLRGGTPGSDSPVRAFIMGSKRWVDLPTWPPETSTRRLHLLPGGRLADDAPPESAPDTHTYDPADPTPSPGGPVLGLHAGRRDNRKVEARPDVLTYTTDPLPQPVTVLGTMRVRVQLHTDNPHIDVFARVCDVAPRGRSINVADQLVRLGPGAVDADGVAVVDLDLNAIGHCFLTGHRLRLQLTGGAHPRFARNLGTGEQVASGATTARSTRQVFHDPARPSWIDLPIFTG